MSRRPKDSTLSAAVALIFVAGWVASWFVYRS